MRLAPALAAALLAFGVALRSYGFPENARVTLEHGDSRVGTYVSSPWGFSTNTHWIEGPEGVILIDTQFLPSAIEEAVKWIEEGTKKKVVLAVVLHANPDKFNGTGYLRARGVRVVTSEQVRALIPAVHAKRVAWFYERYKPDYPKDLVLPDSFGAKTTELSAGGVTIKAHVLGPGASEAHVAVEWEGHLFTGDLIANGVHSWLELGHTGAWLDRLAELRALEPKLVYPGRGPNGGAELLVREDAYLRRALELAAESPNPAALRRAIEAAYPGYRFGAFLDIGLPAVLERAARAKIEPITAPALMAKVKSTKARATIVNMWATWCAPCLEEMPDILRIHRKYRDRGADLILVSGDFPDQLAEAEKTLRELGVDFPSHLKSGKDMEFIDTIDKRWSGSLPSTFVFGAGGKPAHFTEGRIDAATLERQVRGVLGLAP